MIDYAIEHGWVGTTTPGDPEAGTINETVWMMSQDVSLHFLVDDQTDCAYVYTAANSARACQAAEQEVMRHLDVIDRSELLASFDHAESPSEKRQAVLRVALGAPDELDDDTFHRVREAMRESDSEVRKAAVYATSYSPSRRFIPILKSAFREDPSPDVREHAATLIEAYKQMRI
ncbi:HEAT repeat domain-containing protein [Streptomyces pharetrae]